jgi:hypothetical protein
MLPLGLALDEAGQLRIGGGQVRQRWYVHEASHEVAGTQAHGAGG